MPITHDLKVRKKVLGGQDLLTWDGLHNAHGYCIFRSGSEYLRVDSNRSVTLPSGSYTVFATTWQNDESQDAIGALPNFNYAITLNFNYLNIDNFSTNLVHSISGVYSATQAKQLVVKSIYEPNLTFKFYLTLDIVSLTSSQLVLKITPRIKVYAYATETYKTNILLPSTDLTFNF